MVRFYRAFIGHVPTSLESLDPRDAYGYISARAWDRSKPDGRYLQSADGADTFSAWPSLVDGRLRITVGRELVNANPAYEQKGLLDFAKIDKDSKWVALTYCVMFRNGVVGVIESQQGPNIAQLASYVQEKGLTQAPLIFKQLARKSAMAELKRLRYVSKYEIALHPGSLFFPKAEDESGPSDLDRVFEFAASQKDASLVRFSVESADKRSPLHGIREQVERLLQSGAIDSTSVAKFSVSGPDKATENLHPINVLKDFLCVKRSVRLQNKSLEEDGAFQAIEAAFAENLQEFPTIEIRETDK